MRTLKINKTMRTLNANCTGQAVSTRWSCVLCPASFVVRRPGSCLLGPDRTFKLPQEERGEWAVIMRTLWALCPQSLLRGHAGTSTRTKLARMPMRLLAAFPAFALCMSQVHRVHCCVAAVPRDPRPSN